MKVTGVVAVFTWIETELVVMVGNGRSTFRHESRLAVWVCRILLVTDSLF